MCQHTVLQHLIKVLQMRHDDISMLFQDGQSNEDVEIAAEVVCPERFPHSQHVVPFKLSLIPYKQHAEEEEEVG